MERSQIPPLQSLTLRPRPLNTHSIAWSPDAELAVATDECIHLYLPHYPSPRRPGDGPPVSVGVPLPQFTLTTRISSKIKPSVDVNRQLFAFAGVKLPSRDGLEGFGGAGPAMERGAGMFQVVRVEWSPSGMGCNLRPILLALLTNGLLVAFGEHIDHEEVAQIGMRSRTVKTWKILWGLGGALPVPDPEEARSYRFMDERITSMSWAKEIASGRALLAYRTEERDVVIMSVQFGAKAGAVQDGRLQEGWSIQEVARFQANGPHTGLEDATDPDFVPAGTAFSLKWSHWVVEGQTRTATIAYIAPNYVGFRRISLVEEWHRGEQPNLEVEGSDTISSCVFLGSDAFVDFEDKVWVGETGGLTARGYIGTPSELKPFEVNLTGPVEPQLDHHSTVECSTAYPVQDGPSNPIAGIIIHPPDSSAKTPLPLYTAVRLSATGTNQDWFETNLPRDTSKVPSWAERIRKNTTMLLPRATVMGGLEPESDSDDMDKEAEGEEVPEKLEHPYRFRIWGLAASPGGTSTAVVVSKYSSLYPHRQGICSVYFGREPLTNLDITGLTTEGKMWEWMHADGPAVPGVTEFDEIKTEEGHAVRNHLGNGQSSASDLRSLFADVLAKQICMFCDGTLTTTGDSAFCDNGHAWSACVATGLAIMEPGISHVCAVCGMRCLRRSKLEELAREHLGAEVTVPRGSAACESCGGKFVA